MWWSDGGIDKKDLLFLQRWLFCKILSLLPNKIMIRHKNSELTKLADFCILTLVSRKWGSDFDIIQSHHDGRRIFIAPLVMQQRLTLLFETKSPECVFNILLRDLPSRPLCVCKKTPIENWRFCCCTFVLERKNGPPENKLRFTTHFALCVYYSFLSSYKPVPVSHSLNSCDTETFHCSVVFVKKGGRINFPSSQSCGRGKLHVTFLRQ